MFSSATIVPDSFLTSLRVGPRLNGASLQVGKYIIAQWKDKAGSARESHPYRKWIEMYGGPDFDAATKEACDICDGLAASASEETRRDMMQAYLQVRR